MLYLWLFWLSRFDSGLLYLWLFWFSRFDNGRLCLWLFWLSRFDSGLLYLWLCWFSRFDNGRLCLGDRLSPLRGLKLDRRSFGDRFDRRRCLGLLFRRLL